ncbi:hypothetical protein V495_06886 [Pseudogymnoascus sp. VKM F-4514 (FW-929)]|nr:hypothetical protein V495_06886 [Pseudogymnoascus sp. VKM F-4514 (FW-929)]KFY53798.1 hypothetical protein V497_08250 [Pseudogymnoascus sp. VKM F-4516 (FW-969)]
MERSSDPTPRKLSKLACDRCRSRKVKCDYRQPEIDADPNAPAIPAGTCSNCLAAGLECAISSQPKRRGPKPRNRAREYSYYNAASKSPTTPGLDDHDRNESQPIDEDDDSRHVLPVTHLSPIAQRLDSSPHSWVDGTVSSQTAALGASVQSPLSQVALPASLPPLYDVYQDLVITLSRVLPSYSFETITKKCVNLFFEYLFSLIPIVDESNLRYDVHTVCATYGAVDVSSPVSVWSTAGAYESNHISTATVRNTTALAVKLALVTATCAEAAFMIPPQLFPEGPLISSAFLLASRKALHFYLESDLDHPSAASLATRYFHSNCLHADGKSRVSWHIFGEAARLAQTMQLHSEASYQTLEPTEAELRRRCFWILYIGDKSAAILNGLPIALHHLNFVSEVTVAYPTEEGNLVFDSQAEDAEPRSVLTGFNFNLRLWAAASALLLEVRMRVQPRDGSLTGVDDRAIIDRLYIDFMTILDTLPTWLSLDPGASEEAGRCPKEFCIQRVNLRATFHCLRMVVLQKLEAAGLGMEASTALALALRKTEIARDMVRVVRQAPFWALQVNGESCVEKIRLIGVSLLETIHTHKESPLATRARAEFVVLLDVLARLDSRASDALRDGSWQQE